MDMNDFVADVDDRLTHLEAMVGFLYTEYLLGLPDAVWDEAIARRQARPTDVPPDGMRGLLDPEVYEIGLPCPTCGADSWQPCTIRRNRGGTSHALRLSKAGALYRRDVRKAPWVEERVDGVLYTSLSLDGLTQLTHGALLGLFDLDHTQVVKPGEGQPQLSSTEADARFKAGR